MILNAYNPTHHEGLITCDAPRGQMHRRIDRSSQIGHDLQNCTEPLRKISTEGHKGRSGHRRPRQSRDGGLKNRHVL